VWRPGRDGLTTALLLPLAGLRRSEDGSPVAPGRALLLWRPSCCSAPCRAAPAWRLSYCPLAGAGGLTWRPSCCPLAGSRWPDGFPDAPGQIALPPGRVALARQPSRCPSGRAKPTRRPSRCPPAGPSRPDSLPLPPW